MAKDLGIVTAYGYAVQGGYTGTEAQFMALLANARGIVSIENTSTSGAVHTYTITYTDGTTQTYNVTDGEVTQAVLDAAIADVKTDLGRVNVYEKDNLNSELSVELGVFDTSGKRIASTTRARTVALLQAPLSIDVSSGYVIRNVWKYKYDGTFVSYSGVALRHYETTDDSYLYAFVFNKNNEGTISESDLDDIVVSFTSAYKNELEPLDARVRANHSAVSGGLVALEKTHCSYIPMSASTTSSGYRLNADNGLFSANANYTVTKYAVNAGRVYDIKGCERFQFQNDNSAPVAGDGYRIGETFEGDTMAIAPSGATFLLVSAPTSATVSASLVMPNKIYYQKADDDIKVDSVYGDNHIFTIEWKKKGNNNIFDIYYLGKDGNTLTLTQTDWIGPYQVAVVNNIDGDKPTSYEMTGGNHDYSGGQGTGTPTGRTISIQLFADGKEVTDTNVDGYCSRLEILWKNRVQAYNTMKADGTGREVLEEIHSAVFDGYKWEITGRIIPLEQIRIMEYYGLQCTYSQYYNTGGYFVGAVNNELLDLSQNNISGNTKPNEFIAYGTNDEMVMGIDNNYDIGDRRFYASDGTKGLRNAGSVSKAYSFLISTTTEGGTSYHTFDEGEMLSYKGYYIFRPRTL